MTRSTAVLIVLLHVVEVLRVLGLLLRVRHPEAALVLHLGGRLRVRLVADGDGEALLRLEPALAQVVGIAAAVAAAAVDRARHVRGHVRGHRTLGLFC